jgi:hypothetical protein
MKTKDIRAMLCNALKKAERGELPSDEAKTVIGLANQISTSLATEVKVATMKLRMGAQADAIGQLNVTE